MTKNNSVSERRNANRFQFFSVFLVPSFMIKIYRHSRVALKNYFFFALFSRLQIYANNFGHFALLLHSATTAMKSTTAAAVSVVVDTKIKNYFLSLLLSSSSWFIFSFVRSYHTIRGAIIKKSAQSIRCKSRNNLLFFHDF